MFTFLKRKLYLFDCMKHVMKHIHNRPEHQRRHMAWVITIGIGVVLVVVWGISLANPKFNISTTSQPSRNERESTVNPLESLEQVFENVNNEAPLDFATPEEEAEMLRQIFREAEQVSDGENIGDTSLDEGLGF